jgi:hypothetical protein
MFLLRLRDLGTCYIFPAIIIIIIIINTTNNNNNNNNNNSTQIYLKEVFVRDLVTYIKTTRRRVQQTCSLDAHLRDNLRTHTRKSFYSERVLKRQLGIGETRRKAVV